MEKHRWRFMLNKGIRTLLIVNVKPKNGFRIFIPVSLFALYEILDCIRDLLAVISIITPNVKVRVKNKKYNMKGLIDLIDSVFIFLESVKFTEAFDLVDISTEDAKVKIKII